MKDREPVVAPLTDAWLRWAPPMEAPVQPRKPAPGRSFAEILPDLVAQWDVETNGTLTPKDITVWSEVRVWWRCPVAEDHRWEAPVGHRAGAPGSPVCREFRASCTNSLASLVPALAEQLHPRRNSGLRQENVVAGSQLGDI